MKIEQFETYIVNVPFHRAEVSSVVSRAGVTSAIVRLTTHDGTTGWGEASAGADVLSIEKALHAMSPFLMGRSPWESERIRRDLFHRGLWAHRTMTGNYAWAGIDMAMWDLRGKEARLPVHRLLGGAVRNEVDYFYYLVHGPSDDLMAQCEAGLTAGYEVFYLKVGIDIDRELRMVDAIRKAIGPERRIRIDANGSWSPDEAVRHLKRFEPYDLDFVEQPVREHPSILMAQLRRRTPIPLAANEGLWTESEACRLIIDRVADVYTLSPYWVGSLDQFRRVAYVAEAVGSRVCRHSHGELGIAAAAFHQASLTVPNLVDGNQQSAGHLDGDILVDPLPIASSPKWGTPHSPGLGVEVDEHALKSGAERFAQQGQYLPYGQL